MIFRGRSCMLYGLFIIIMLLHKTLAVPFGSLTTQDKELETQAIRHDAYYIFNSLIHLLRQWGTTLAPNGFSYTYATIPAHTPFYHGRKDRRDPPSPEWLAFDPEMSLGIMLNGWGETYLHVYISKRELKVLYIDGMSAALTSTGTLDSQDVLLYGKVKPDFWNIWDEYGRAYRLCHWAKHLDIEGFVRTNAGFELLWCDFNDGIERIQHLNVTDWWTEMTGEPLGKPPWGPGGPPTHPPPSLPSSYELTLPYVWEGDYSSEYDCDYSSSCYPPTRRRGRSPFGSSTAWEWLRSATESYSGQGEYRIQLDTSRMVSAYGRAGLSESLATLDMKKHRLINITEAVSLAYRHEIEYMASETWVGSGINWRNVADLIVTRYGQRLPEIQKHLTNSTLPALRKARLVVASTIMPFSRSTNTMDENLRQCTKAFTTSISREVLDLNEYKLMLSIETVHYAICEFLFGLYDAFRPLHPVQDSSLLNNVQHDRFLGGEVNWIELASQWSNKLSQLMVRLDWKLWGACKEACDADELCYLPIWPIGRHAFAMPGRDPPILPTKPFCANLDWYASP